MTRNQRAARRRRILGYLVFLAALAAGLLAALSAMTTPAIAETAADEPVAAEESPEDFENEKISQALYASGYFREDIPLDEDTQAYLRSACEESGVPYELALAVIWKETGFLNVTGDGGDSTGYMQVQRRWHEARMARLGVSDLSDPYSNFRVGCDYLAELTAAYPLEEALTAYNSGSPGKSEYARAVMEHMEGLQ